MRRTLLRARQAWKGSGALTHGGKYALARRWRSSSSTSWGTELCNLPSTQVVSRREGHACFITLDRPEKRNALSMVAYKELELALRAASEDDDVRLCVLTGEGSFFSAGSE